MPKIGPFCEREQGGRHPRSREIRRRTKYCGAADNIERTRPRTRTRVSGEYSNMRETDFYRELNVDLQKENQDPWDDIQNFSI